MTKAFLNGFNVRTSPRITWMNSVRAGLSERIEQGLAMVYVPSVL